MRFNRTKFFTEYHSRFGSLTQQAANGLSQLLDFIEADKYITRIEWAAYILATTKHETANTYHPIHEYGSHKYFVQRYGGQTRKGRELGNDTPEEGADYAGRGYPQTTGETNYEKAEKAIREQYPEIVTEFEARTGRKFDLTVGDQPGDSKDPDNMLDPAIAYATMSYGMRTGMFTGIALSKTGNNYKAWRRIINGTDKAETIAGYANTFDGILSDSLLDMDAVIPLVIPPVEEDPAPDTGSTAGSDTSKDGKDPSGDSDGSKAVETKSQDMPDPAAPPKTTEQTSDIQVNGDTTAVTANTKVGGLHWLVGSIIAIVTGQAAVPEFVNNGLQSPSFWTVILNIFQNLWTFRKWIIAGLLVIFIVRKIEVTLLKISAMHVNADPTKGQVVLTRPAATATAISWVRGKLGW